MRLAALGANAFREGLQRFQMARTSGDDGGESLAGEGARYRRAEAVARPDHHADAAPCFCHDAPRGRTKKAISACAR